MFSIVTFVLLSNVYNLFCFFLTITALLFNVYFNCLNIKCAMNRLTLAISSNESYVISMLNVCIQIVLNPSCLSKNLYHQCTIILFQGVLTLQLMCHDGATYSFINGIGLTEANSLIHLLNNDDTDDDNQLHLVKHSAYYGKNELLLSSKAGMSILSGNIQSINAKFDEFSSFVDRVNTHNPISAILLQECWIDGSAIDSLAMFNLKDYNMVYQTSRCYKHGGFLIYIHKQFKYTLIDTINQDATGWEYLCVEMSHRAPHSQKYLLCNVYRKPGEIVDEMNAFLAEFSTILQKVKNLNKLSYICGDYNIDLLKLKVNPRFGEFFDHIISSGFFPKITLPIRFSDQSATLIDNVFSTNIEEKEVSGILLNHISDHQLLSTYIENLSYIEKVPKFINIQKTDPLSVDNYIHVNELREDNIYDRMHQPLDIYYIYLFHTQSTHIDKSYINSNTIIHRINDKYKIMPGHITVNKILRNNHK